MSRTTRIAISTGSDNRHLSAEVVFAHLARSLRGRTFSGLVQIAVEPDGTIRDTTTGEVLHVPPRSTPFQHKMRFSDRESA